MLTAEREALVVENIKLTHHIAKKYFHPHLDHDDLAGIGTIGLIKAAKTFDESKGYKFSSLAYKAIEREIIKEIIKFSRAKRNGIVYSFEDHIADNLTIGDTIFDTKNFSRFGIGVNGMSNFVEDYPTEDVFGTEILPGDTYFKFGEIIVLSQNIDDYILEHLNADVFKAIKKPLKISD